ncbi:MAG: cadherin-like beta sandwich domain-containing protein, partial [Gammaproteobacteria bacterium]|nr:cadherin-like beta sandwich domain-containing protein [Gammaproteobacteria bacterium]
TRTAYNAVIIRNMADGSTPPSVSTMNLSELNLLNANIDQTFNTDLFTYSATVSNSVTDLTLLPLAVDVNATVVVGSNTVFAGDSVTVPLVVGDNQITIMVIAADGSGRQEYNIYVLREARTNADLSNITLSSGSLGSFSSGTTNYNVSVDKTVATLDIMPFVVDSGSIVKMNGQQIDLSTGMNMDLAVGSNLVTIEVIAQDKSTVKTYTLNVNRVSSGTDGSGSVDLSSLSLSSGSLDQVFNAGVNTYSQTVPNSTSSVSVTATAADPLSTIKVNGSTVPAGATSIAQSLVVGGNNVVIVVTSPDGLSSKTYAVVVMREGSVSTLLTSLDVSSGALTPAFSPSITTYTQTVSNAVNTLTVLPTADANSTITVNNAQVVSGQSSNSIALGAGDTAVAVTVTAADGTSTTYNLTVTKQVSSDASLSGLTTSQGALNETFNSSLTSFTKTVGGVVSAISLTPTASDPSSIISVNNVALASGQTSANIPLAMGVNVISVTVVAANATFKSYIVAVTRTDSKDAALQDFTASTGTFSYPFAAGTSAYYQTVSMAVDYISVTPTTNHAGATVTVNGMPVISGTPSAMIPVVAGIDNFITTVVTAQDTSITKTYYLVVTKLKGTNADLAELSLPGGFSPAFSSAVTSYSNTVGNQVTSASVFVRTVDSKVSNITIGSQSVVSGTFTTVNLNPGLNPINVTVTAEDGVTSKAYTINITRTALAGTDATLSSLSASTGLSPAFAASKTLYTQNVSYAQSSVDVTAVLNDSNAVGLTIAGQTATQGVAQTIPLSTGSNTILVVGTAENGATKTYSITITRALALSSDATLSGLTASTGFTPSFLPSVYSYSATVASTQSSIDIAATLNDIKAKTLTIDNQVGATNNVVLHDGLNAIDVVVTAENGSTRMYTLSITRTAPAANSKLASLQLSVGTLDQTFDPTASSYTATEGFLVKSLRIVPKAQDTGSTIKVNGQSVADGAESQLISLNTGSNNGAVAVVVTGVDGSSTAYSIDISRQSSAAFGNNPVDYMKASNAVASNQLGGTIAISGDSMVTGGGKGGNKVYVFDRSSVGNWTESKISPSDTASGDDLGKSVDIDGDTLVVGASLEDGSVGGINAAHDDLLSSSGAAYVYTRSAGGSWSQQAKLKAPNGRLSSSDRFGQTVAISGDIIAVGAYRDDNSQNGITHGTSNSSDNSSTDSGAVYVFKRTNGVWAQEAFIKPSATAADMRFGGAIAMDGNTLIVGAERENGELGAAYIFVRSASGTWSQQQKLSEPVSSKARFGDRVAIHSDTVLVGVPLDSTNASGSGRVFVYTRSGTSWTRQATLSQSAVTSGDAFGSGLAVYNDTILIGVPADDSTSTGVNGSKSDGGSNSGAVYVFTRSGNTWSEAAYVKATNTGDNDAFGTAVAIDKDTAALGAPSEDGDATRVNGTSNNNLSNAGAGYIYQ